MSRLTEIFHSLTYTKTSTIIVLPRISQDFLYSYTNLPIELFCSTEKELVEYFEKKDPSYKIVVDNGLLKVIPQNVTSLDAKKLAEYKAVQMWLDKFKTEKLVNYLSDSTIRQVMINEANDIVEATDADRVNLPEVTLKNFRTQNTLDHLSKAKLDLVKASLLYTQGKYTPSLPSNTETDTLIAQHNIKRIVQDRTEYQLSSAIRTEVNNYETEFQLSPNEVACLLVASKAKTKKDKDAYFNQLSINPGQVAAALDKLKTTNLVNHRGNLTDEGRTLVKSEKVTDDNFAQVSLYATVKPQQL